jgi:hypothetical protein
MVPSPRAIYIGFIGFVALFVVLFAWFSGLPYWASALIVVAAILVNGLVARIEDDLPGGFNNPDGTDTPAYVHRVGAVTRWTGGIACWSTAAGVVFSMYYYDAPRPAAALSISAAIVCVGVAVVTRRQRPRWMWMSIGMITFVVGLVLAQRT